MTHLLAEQEGNALRADFARNFLFLKTKMVLVDIMGIG